MSTQFSFAIFKKDGKNHNAKFVIDQYGYYYGQVSIMASNNDYNKSKINQPDNTF